MNERDNVIGHKIKVEANKSHNIIIYSDKLSENFVSSQECFVKIIQALTEKHRCWLVSDQKRQASAFYKNLAPYYNISMNNKEGIDQASNMLINIKPSIIIPITQNKEFELMAKNSYLYSVHSMDSLSSLREVDYRFKSGSTINYELPFSRSIKLENIDCTVFAPNEGVSRNYIDGNNKRDNFDSEIRLGAFCRLAKLDNETLRTWAVVLKEFQNAKLYFAYIQTNKTSEEYTKAFFETMGGIQKNYLS